MGWDAVHVRDLGLQEGEDSEILSHAVLEGRIVISFDSDFGELLVRNPQTKASLVYVRSDAYGPPRELAVLIDEHLRKFHEELRTGAIVVIRRNSARLRMLTGQ